MTRNQNRLILAAAALTAALFAAACTATGDATGTTGDLSSGELLSSGEALSSGTALLSSGAILSSGVNPSSQSGGNSAGGDPMNGGTFAATIGGVAWVPDSLDASYLAGYPLTVSATRASSYGEETLSFIVDSAAVGVNGIPDGFYGMGWAAITYDNVGTEQLLLCDSTSTVTLTTLTASTAAGTFSCGGAPLLGGATVPVAVDFEVFFN